MIRDTRNGNGAISWMAGNSIASNILMAVLLIGGLFMGFNVKQEIFPEFDRGIVQISVSYPGASPEEVERGIVLAMEEAVQGLDGVDELSSRASEGSAGITIVALEGVDLQQFSQDIQSKVDGVTTLPDEAEIPRVYIPTRKREVISYTIYGDQKPAVIREYAEILRDSLLQSPEITQVELTGIRDYEIQVEIPKENLRRYGLTLEEVAARIRSTSVEIPGGGVKTKGGEILVRMSQREETADEYTHLPIITGKDGSVVTLSEIATIKEGFSDTTSFALYNGQPAIRVQVYRVGDQTPIKVSDAAKKVVETQKLELPDGVNLSMLRDSSEIFRQRAELLLKNGYMGLCLVFFFLALFLEIRLAFWVSLGIPISFLGSFLLLPIGDFSINIISMFAFIVTLGIVVDDAIVVGENIYSKRQLGMPFMEASIAGVKEVAVPVTFSVLTNMVAFLPLFFVPGFMGKIYKVIPMVVIMVFLISLVESLFILPAHLSHGEGKSGGILGPLVNVQQRFSAFFTRCVFRYYGPFLKIALKNRYTTFALGIAIFLVTLGFVTSGRMGMTLFPSVESDYAFVSATLPYGSPEARTVSVQKKLVDKAQKIIDENGGKKLARGIYSQISDNEIAIRVYLTPPDVRPLSTGEFTTIWRKSTGEIPGLESIQFMADRGGPGSGKNLRVELSHRDVATLEKAGQDLARELATFPKVSEIDDGSAQGKEQLNFRMLKQGEMSGFTASSVARQVRSAFYGVEALSLQRGRNEVEVRVSLPEEQRRSEYTLENLMVRSPEGIEAPLGSVVSIERGRAYTTIRRQDGKRIAPVEANVTPRAQAGTVISVLKKDILVKLKKQYPGLSYSFKGRQADMRESTQALMQGLGMALLCIYAMLAIPFRSYIQPLIIMTSIPFGFVGVVAGHLLMGYSLSVMSLFGMVALSGVVVNDSLILIDTANRKRRSGVDPFQAIQEAGIQRFRPILLTTLTTFGGLAPMIFETSRQARFLIPMALALGFGVLFATLIILLMVPALYMITEDAKSLLPEKEQGSEPALTRS